MKQQVFYIHGGESYIEYADYLERLKTQDIWDLPNTEQKGKWTKTLREDLGDGYEVFMPAMPNKQNAKYQEWKIWFERHFEHLEDGVILIGCSLGAMFLYKYFIEHTAPFTVKALVLMASPVTMEGHGSEVEGCGDFSFSLDDVSVLEDRAHKVVIMHSEDDFLVPYAQGVSLSEAMPFAEFVSFSDKNHFLVPELPELIEKIEEIAHA